MREGRMKFLVPMTRTLLATHTTQTPLITGQLILKSLLKPPVHLCLHIAKVESQCIALSVLRMAVGQKTFLVRLLQESLRWHRSNISVINVLPRPTLFWLTQTWLELSSWVCPRLVTCSTTPSSYKLKHRANVCHTNVSIKAIQNVARVFKVTQLARFPSASTGTRTLFEIWPSTVIRLDLNIFLVKDQDALSKSMHDIWGRPALQACIQSLLGQNSQSKNKGRRSHISFNLVQKHQELTRINLIMFYFN